jgi:hypothetical protein
MKFNFGLFFEQVIHSIFRSSGTPGQFSIKRVAVLIMFLPVFLSIKLCNSLGCLLDEIFYPEYHNTKISEPVFILGNMRSGSTYLHRLLARDKQNFSIIRLWEIIFAHSIFQRKLIWNLKSIDDFLGGGFQKLMLLWEEKSWFSNPMHKIGLIEPHEDEGLFMSIWETINTSIFFPHLHLVERYAFFDKQISLQKKKEVMGFYKGCLKRHLYARRTGRQRFLSKSPAFSPKIKTLLENFPQSKVIYLVRSPYFVVPSFISWMTFQWEKFTDWPERYFYQEELMEVAKEWYEYPLEILDQTPDSSYIIIKYENLVNNPEQTISRVYKKFNISISKEFHEILKLENEKQKKYKSKHSYSLAAMGLTKEIISNIYEDIIKKFRYES